MSRSSKAPRTSWVVFTAALVLGVGATAAQADGGREETGRYVATPSDGDASGPHIGAGLGRVDFEILDGESRVVLTVADAAFDRTEVDAVFLFGDAPIRHVVTFCRQHGMDIPSGATDVRVVVEGLFPTAAGTDSTCGSEHGATTGTVTARFG